jgi:hypothetical protein
MLQQPGTDHYHNQLFLKIGHKHLKCHPISIKMWSISLHIFCTYIIYKCTDMVTFYSNKYIDVENLLL